MKIHGVEISEAEMALMDQTIALQAQRGSWLRRQHGKEGLEILHKRPFSEAEMDAIETASDKFFSDYAEWAKNADAADVVKTRR